MPAAATPLQRAQLLAALSLGIEISRLRPVAHFLGLDTELKSAFVAVAQGESTIAVARLIDLDAALAAHAATGTAVMRGRGSILVILGVLTQHAEYFDSGE
jgi:hypothetical protein